MANEQPIFIPPVPLTEEQIAAQRKVIRDLLKNTPKR